MDISESRPAGYQYMKILSEHLGGSLSCIFNGELIYPRQIEVQLPGDHETACNFNCTYCAGRFLDHPLENWEDDALALMEKLAGKIPFYNYSGLYTEPLLNPRLMEFLRMTKKYGSRFGIHTNGSLLLQLEKEQSFLSELCSIATSSEDFLSISLDAGSCESHCRTKGLKEDWFSRIIEGIRMVAEIRGEQSSPAIRVLYLVTALNNTAEEIRSIIGLMQEIEVDSLRFSVPTEHFGKDFASVSRYRDSVEVPLGLDCAKILKPFLSESVDEKPFIFYRPPCSQDVTRLAFRQCIFGYFAIAFASDGFVYKCSSATSSLFKKLRLGRITGDLQKFNEMILANYDPDFDRSTCSGLRARCSRVALELNSGWSQRGNKNESHDDFA